MVRLSEAYHIGKQTDKRIGFLNAYNLVDSYRLLDEINSLDPAMRQKSDSELQAYTSHFRQRLSEGETMDEILPEAYAVVREAARRIYGENRDSPKGSARADPDKCSEIFGTDPDGRTLEDAVAKFGRHYDVQVVGGIELHKGNVAEMYTGEGKTIVATLPAYLNALTGEGVHIVTTNDYLARRDAKWMAPLFNFLGMSVGARFEKDGDQNGAEVYTPGKTEKNQPAKALRKEAYGCDVTYGTVSRFVFDYLFDKSAKTSEERVQRGHNFALIDEVDLVLLDKANIPHIVKGQEQLTEKETGLVYTADQIARKLILNQERLTGGKKYTPEDILNFYSVDEKRNLVCIDENGFRWMENNLEGILFGKYDTADIELIAYVTKALEAHILYEKNRQYKVEGDSKASEDEKSLYRVIGGLVSAQRASGSKARGNSLYRIDRKNNAVNLTKKGIEWIRKNAGTSSELLAEIKQGDRAVDILNLALASYILHDGNKPSDKVILIDEPTGQPLPNNRYQDGLHEAIEAKEGVNLGSKGMTLGTITTPFYFANYKKRAGMTGTAVEAKKEFADVYGMDVVPIPTNKKVIRQDHPDVVCGSRRAKFESIASEVERIHSTGRPVLVGTTSIQDSEYLASILEKRNLKRTERDFGSGVIKEKGDFEVLNARRQYLAAEAEIIEKAGRGNAITIATNMAGRGADIAVDKEAGGLYVIGAERHFAGRIDNQLRGRAGRQGDPGDSRFFTSIEDRLYKYVPDWVKKAIALALGEDGTVESRYFSKKVGSAQKITAENQAHERKKLFDYDSVLDRQRSALYEIKDSILDGEDVRGYLLRSLENVVTQIVRNAEDEAKEITSTFTKSIAYHNLPEELVKNGFSEWYEMKNGYSPEKEMVWDSDIRDFLVENQIGSIFGTNVHLGYGENAVERICQVIEGEYLSAVRENKDIFSGLEKEFLLKNIDDYWSCHLDELERILPGMKLRAYAGKKPIFEYLRESSKEFETFMNHTSGLAVAMVMQKARVNNEIKKIQENDIQEYLLGALENLVSPTIKAAEEKVSLLSQPEINDILEDPSFREWYSERFSTEKVAAEDVDRDDFRDYFLEREMNRQFIGEIRVPVYTQSLAKDLVSQLERVYKKEAESHGDGVFDSATKNILIGKIEEAYGPSQISRLDDILRFSLRGGLLAETPNDVDLFHAVEDVYTKAKIKSGEIFGIVEDLALSEWCGQMKGSRAEDFGMHPEAQAFYESSIVRWEEAKQRLRYADRASLRAANEFRKSYEGKSSVSETDVRNFLFVQELKRRYFADLSVKGLNESNTVEKITEELEKIWKQRERTIREAKGEAVDSLDYLLQPEKAFDDVVIAAARHAALSAIGRKLSPRLVIALM
ncbi:hypothetical protein JW707_02600 [Candidatus Woesearchaeota archaeon]|nr:hypothetical protein [Candidatus Woesearchaeota archaeon]